MWFNWFMHLSDPGVYREIKDLKRLYIFTRVSKYIQFQTNSTNWLALINISSAQGLYNGLQ